MRASLLLCIVSLVGCGAEPSAGVEGEGEVVDKSRRGKADNVDRNPGVGAVGAGTSSAESRPLRVAATVAVDVASPPLGAGGTFSTTVREPGATFVRLHFDRLELADGDRLVIAHPDGTVIEELAGGARAGWSLRVPGEEVRLSVTGGAAARTSGFHIDQLAHGTVDLDGPRPTAASAPGTLESVCGGDDKRPAACFTDGVVATAARAVAHLTFSADGGQAMCTGWLVSAQGHMLTNNHCVASQADVDTLEVQFNYQTASCTGTQTATVAKWKGGRFVKTSQPYDYTLVQLPAEAAAQFGFIEIDPRALQAGEPIFIPQHPGGRRKEIATVDSENGGRACSIAETNVSVGGFASGANAGYRCDTEGGSSGSPVVSATTGRAIALHHLGGCSNSGTQLVSLWSEIAALVGGSAPPPPPPAADAFTVSGQAPLSVPDLGDVRATATVPAGARVRTLDVELDIAHTWRGDLEVTLVSPGGKTATVVARSNPNDSTQNLTGRFAVAGLAGEGGGVYTLRVRDLAREDAGTLRAWRLVGNAR